MKGILEVARDLTQESQKQTVSVVEEIVKVVQTFHQGRIVQV